MAIRSILVNLDNSRHTQARVDVAAALAIQHEAHLVGLASMGWALMPADYDGTLGLGAYQAAAIRGLEELAQACIADFRQQVQRLGVPSHEERAEIGFPVTAMPRAARYCDLTVITQVDPDDEHALRTPQLAEDVLLQSGRPLLVLPYAGESRIAPPRRVLVGWNGSREAARALHDALPFLQRADTVEVAAFAAPDDLDADLGDVPGADIGLWLARHGVQVEVKPVAATVAAGEALLSHAADMNADLLVAGGYGHTRFREAILGGVTRTLLHSATLPVLLSH